MNLIQAFEYESMYYIDLCLNGLCKTTLANRSCYDMLIYGPVIKLKNTECHVRQI